MIKIFLISIILIAISFLFLGIQILLKKKGEFPETHVGENKKMRNLGISCAKCENAGKCSVKN
jgi:hypothetical protein